MKIENMDNQYLAVLDAENAKCFIVPLDGIPFKSTPSKLDADDEDIENFIEKVLKVSINNSQWSVVNSFSIHS